MTDETEAQQKDVKLSDKELNFRALEAKYRKELEQEKAEKERILRELQEKSHSMVQDDDDDQDPYVDHKKLEKKLNRLGQTTQSEIQKAMELAKEKAKQELKRELWLEKNPDFYEVLKHADKLYEKNQELAETILEMPEGFERHKLVYKNIKALGIDKPQTKDSSIQEKIQANRRSPYYQPSGVGNAPYAAVGDFSPSGQKQAYEKLQQLKSQLRL